MRRPESKARCVKRWIGHPTPMTDATAQTPFIIDDTKLSAKGHEMFGGMIACDGISEIFANMRDRTDLVQERVFLNEMIQVVRDYGEAVKTELTALCLEEGSGEFQGTSPGTDTRQ